MVGVDEQLEADTHHRHGGPVSCRPQPPYPASSRSFFFTRRIAVALHIASYASYSSYPRKRNVPAPEYFLAVTFIVAPATLTSRRGASYRLYFRYIPYFLLELLFEYLYSFILRYFYNYY